MMRKLILRVKDEPGPRVVSELLPGRPQRPPESVLAKACQPGRESLPGPVNSLQCRAWHRIPLPGPGHPAAMARVLAMCIRPGIPIQCARAARRWSSPAAVTVPARDGQSPGSRRRALVAPTSNRQQAPTDTHPRSAPRDVLGYVTTRNPGCRGAAALAAAGSRHQACQRRKQPIPGRMSTFAGST